MTDQDLAHALSSRRVRPSDAYARLFDAYGEQLYRECWRRLGDPDIAQTVLRDTFIVARAHIDRLPDPDRLGDWLRAVARAECERHRPENGGAEAARDGVVEDAAWHRDPADGAHVPPRPACLRVRVLSGVAGPDLAGFRGHVAARADYFGRCGFPVPPPARCRDGRLARLVPGVIVAACALLIVVLVLYVSGWARPELATSWLSWPNSPVQR